MGRASGSHSCCALLAGHLRGAYPMNCSRRGAFSGENMQCSVDDRSGSAGRFHTILYLTALFAACTLLYWNALNTWFQNDDLNWLHLRLGVRNGRELWNALFTPMAQGTVRALSERAYFIGLSHWFGIDPLPFHVLAFA